MPRYVSEKEIRELEWEMWTNSLKEFNEKAKTLDPKPQPAPRTGPQPLSALIGKKV